jgi:hypothetical protein
MASRTPFQPLEALRPEATGRILCCGRALQKLVHMTLCEWQCQSASDRMAYRQRVTVCSRRPALTPPPCCCYAATGRFAVQIEQLLGPRGWGGLLQLPEWTRCRVASMLPGGPVATVLAAHGVTLKVTENSYTGAGVFVMEK